MASYLHETLCCIDKGAKKAQRHTQKQGGIMTRTQPLESKNTRDGSQTTLKEELDESYQIVASVCGDHYKVYWNTQPVTEDFS